MSPSVIPVFPSLSFPTFVLDVCNRGSKSGIQGLCFSFVREETTLDSCFRRNDSSEYIEYFRINAQFWVHGLF